MSPSALTEDKPVFLDTISEVTDGLDTMTTVSELVSLLTLAYKTRIPPAAKRARLATLMHTMASTSHNQSVKASSHDELLSSFVCFLTPVLSGMAGLEEFQTAVEAFAKPDDFRDFWTIEGHNLIKEIIGGDGYQNAIKSSDTPFLGAFVKDSSCKIGLGRNTGCLFLLPGNSALEDEAWIRDGDGQPSVLRRMGNEWNNIGKAYVDVNWESAT
ncbi:hypothetical protein S40288_01933 [Stachybotrys chartarum IBT 40288]|nr:hypothetical protein S40288_01933 [Stachybotrys chartarum IBT 40288]